MQPGGRGVALSWSCALRSRPQHCTRRRPAPLSWPWGQRFMLRLPSSGCSSPTPTRPLVRPPGPGERPHSPRRVPQDLCRHRGRFLPRTRGRRPKDVRAASSQPHLPWGSSVVRPCALPPRRAALQEVTDARGQVLPAEMLLQAGRCLLPFFLEAAVFRRRSWLPARSQRSPHS